MRRNFWLGTALLFVFVLLMVGSEKRVVVSGHALVADLTCASSTTLESLAAGIRDQMPKSDSNGFVAPTATEQADWRAVVNRMLRGSCDFTLPASLSGIMQIKTFFDSGNGRNYCVLMEVRDADGNGVVDRGWGTFIVNNGAMRELSGRSEFVRNTSTYRRNAMSTISITSNEGALNSASAVLEVAATNPEYNQPALRIRQAGKRGGAASIRIDDPNPDIEFVETDQVAPAGKYEIAVQSDKLQINGRNADDTAFETLVVFQRRAAGGNIGIRTTSQFGGGHGVMAIANATVAPSGNPAGGGILYVEDGALKYRGSNGTVTVIAPA